MCVQVIQTGSHTFDRITFKFQSQKLQIEINSALVQELKSVNALVAEQDTVTTNEILPGQILVLRAGKQVSRIISNKLCHGNDPCVCDICILGSG